MGIFIKIKDHIKNITTSAKQEAQEQKERAEIVAEAVEKKAHRAKSKGKGSIKKGKNSGLLMVSSINGPITP